MDTHRSLRQRLQSTVLEASTSAGKAYNAVIFGELSPALNQFALDRSGSERFLGGFCGVFLFFVFLLQVVLGYGIFVIESARPDSQFQTAANGLY